MPSQRTVLTNHFESRTVEDGPTIGAEKHRYQKIGYFSMSRRSPAVGLSMLYRSCFEDPLDNWRYALGVVIGDAVEWGNNPYLDLSSV